MPCGLCKNHSRNQSPLKVLRVLLFLIRSSLLPLTAIALIGFWFNSSETHHNQQRVVILDDAIGAWETGADGQCAMASHIKTIGLMQSQTNQPIHIVLLSGRSVSSADVLHTLKPISSGPNWELATHKAKQLVDQHEIKQIVLLSELRNGVLQSFSGEFIPGVVNSFIPPDEAVRSTVRVMGVDTPRDVLLPGDPFRLGQLMIDLSRSNATDSAETTVLLDVLGADNTTVQSQSKAVLTWNPGEHNRRLSMGVPEVLPTEGLIHIHIDESSSPATHRWLRIRKPDSAQVTMITSEGEHVFDPASAASWLSAGIQAGSQNGDLELQWLNIANLQVDAIMPNMPVVVTEPSLLTPSTWDAMSSRRNAGPILIIPPINAAPSWLDNAMESMNGSPSIEGLPIFQPNSTTNNIVVASDAGALELISSELQSLLQPVNIERMVDLRPLLDCGMARELVSVGEYPMFVQVHKTNTIISAIAWHPSWSDLPIRSAAPTILQEALRSKSWHSKTGRIVASSPNNMVAGPQSDGSLIQPDVISADQSPANLNAIKQLEEIGWSPQVVYSKSGSETLRSSTIAALLFILLCIEVILAHIIDRHRSTRHVVSRAFVP